jgi:hypothetical protein
MEPSLINWKTAPSVAVLWRASDDTKRDPPPRR